MTNVLLPCRLDCSGVAVRVAVGAAQHVAPTEGGVQHNEVGGCNIPPVHVPLCLFGCFVLHRLDRTAPAEREKTGATPPFFAAGAARRVGGCHTWCNTRCNTPRRHGWGSLPSEIIPAGRLRRPPTGARRRAEEPRDA